MNDGYLQLCNSIQGLRRHIEQVSSTVSAALGVRASIYPHQVGTVWRILSDLHVRHLLADEVGLGKTVQALMVINAIRLESPDATVAIVVPDSLMPQWRDELLGRGHEAPMFEDSIKAGAERHIHLLWPKMLQRASVIDPSKYSLVVVDELHNLQVEIRDHLARNARRFTGLLVLTATPKFQDSARRLEMLALLEPDRVYLAATAVTSVDQWIHDEPFRRWPQELQEAILAHLLEEEQSIADLLDQASVNWKSLDLDTPPAHSPVSSAALRWCIHRRIIRSRRSSFRGLLPERSHVPTTVEPTAGEIDRQHAIWAYIHSLPADGTVDRELLARRSIIGPQSLCIRVRELVRSGHDPDGRLADIDSPLVANEGDSRLDALIDILATTWAKFPDERVVVACQDSPTVDYLSRNIRARLSEIGPHRNRALLEVVEIRGGKDDAPSDLLAADSPAQQALASFQRGDSHLLLASDVAHVGLNLQCARMLVLYSVPWGPDEVEQWIGRLDRIGNNSIFRNGETLPIDVLTIVQHGLIDEQIVDVLSHFDVFEQVLDLEDAALLATAHDAVRRGALDGTWSDIDGAVRRLEDIDVHTPLQQALPYGPEFALHVYDEEFRRPPADPPLAYVDESHPGWRWREIAVEAWLRLLKRAGAYDIRRTADPVDSTSKFRTLWYTKEDTRAVKHGESDTIAILPRMHDPMDRSPEHAEAFITRRSDIRHPPRVQVTLDVKFKHAMRPLQYLNHGSLLHEDLVHCWTQVGRESPPAHGHVVFPQGHPALISPGEGTYAITVGWADAGEHVLSSIDDSLGTNSEVACTEVFPHAVASHRNDRWWIRGILPAQMLCYVERVALNRTPEPIDNPATCWALLRPFLPNPDGHELPHATKWIIELDSEGIARHQSRAHEFLKRTIAHYWLQSEETLKRAVRTRLFVLAGEAQTIDAVNDDLIAKEEARVAALDPATAQIVRARANARLTRAIAIRDAQRQMHNERQDRIDQMTSRVTDPSFNIFSTTIMTVKSH